MLPQLAIPEKEIVDFCQRHYIQKLSIFGSALREDFHSQSDVDILVEFDPEHIPGWEFVSMQDELTQIIGRTVDLNTPGFLSDTFRDDILEKALVVYEQSG